MGVGVAALVFFWVGLLLAVVVPCMFAGGGAVVVADSKEEWSASFSRLEYGLKTEESGRMRMSDFFEKWVGSGGVVVAAGEKNKKKLLDDDDSTRQKKVKSREHVDDLKEELGGDSSWAAATAAGGTSAAAQSWVQQQQQHTKEDGDDQSYQQSGLSVQERDELKIIASSSSLRGDLMKLSNGTEVQLFPSVEVAHHKHVNETRRRLGIFSSAHHALAVTGHTAGVSHSSVVITSNVTLRVFHLAFVPSSPSPAPVLDAALEGDCGILRILMTTLEGVKSMVDNYC